MYKESGLLPEALAALEAAHELLLQPAEQQPGQQQAAEQRPAPPAAEGDQPKWWQLFAYDEATKTFKPVSVPRDRSSAEEMLKRG